MRRKTNQNNQVSLHDFQKNINRSFMLSLSANSLLDEVRYSTEEITNSTFLGNSLRQLKWITSQINELEEYMLDMFDVNPEHPYRLKIQSLFREIAQHIEKAQSAIVCIKLNSIGDINIDLDDAKLDVHLYNLNNTLISLYDALKHARVQNN